MAGAVTVGGVAGCSGDGDRDGNGGGTTTVDEVTTEAPMEYAPGDVPMNAMAVGEFQGSGVFLEGRPAPGGRSITDLPNLSGELSIYLGGGEGGLYLRLFDFFERIYPEFSYSHSSKVSSTLATQIVEEHRADQVQADLFISIGAGSLGTVADAGATRALSTTTVDPVPEAFVQPDRQWVGVAGRARAIPYNTDRFSESDVPDQVAQFPDTAAFQGAIGWAPTYGAFQDFVTAMRLLRGEEATREWLSGIQNLGVDAYPDEFQVSDAVAGGELGAGFANHYYALRVLNSAPDAPLDLAFTSGDAGSLVNVSGAALLDREGNSGLADVFARHLLSAEAQEFFATRTYAYPMIPGVKPVGGLPRIDELDTPDIDLTALSETGPTLSLLRDSGVL